MDRKAKFLFVIVGACTITGGAAFIGNQAENRDRRGETDASVVADREALSAEDAYRRAQATIVLPQASWEQLFMHGR